jgi:Fic family protein
MLTYDSNEPNSVVRATMAQLDATARIGNFIQVVEGGIPVRAYIPPDLPVEPAVMFDARAQRLLQEAYLALGRLDGAVGALPDRDLLYYLYLRKEAVLSSQIEGTQSSLESFLQMEHESSPPAPRVEYHDLLNYITAMETGLARMNAEGITVELLETMHGILLSNGRGSETARGRLRTEQNFIGGRRGLAYVPPPPELVRPKMENLIWFIREGPSPAGMLGKAAIAHAQFESIHPFMDGNGRIGRMLITLMLCQAGVLRWPVLILSLFFKKHRGEYYEILTDLREHGDWEGWIAFMLTGVIETAGGVSNSATQVTELVKTDRDKLSNLGARHGNAVKVFEYLLRSPVTTVTLMMAESHLARATVASILESFCELGLCSEVTGKKRNRLYRYNAYMDMLNEGTETN